MVCGRQFEDLGNGAEARSIYERTATVMIGSCYYRVSMLNALPISIDHLRIGVSKLSKNMGREYKIQCTPVKGTKLAVVLRKLPSPISRPNMIEIYNFRVDDNGYYLVDHLVDRKTAATALQIFVDAALSTGREATIIEP